MPATSGSAPTSASATPKIPHEISSVAQLRFAGSTYSAAATSQEALFSRTWSGGFIPPTLVGPQRAALAVARGLDRGAAARVEQVRADRLDRAAVRGDYPHPRAAAAQQQRLGRGTRAGERAHGAEAVGREPW